MKVFYLCALSVGLFLSGGVVFAQEVYQDLKEIVTADIREIVSEEEREIVEGGFVNCTFLWITND